jgi:XTP/dITP diphosphohydrolase
VKNSQIVLASNNEGKVAEIQGVMADLHLQIIPQFNFSIPEIAETGLSFVENALIKARHAAQHTKLPAIADDSGLAIDYLQGAPGIYSSRYAGEPSNDIGNIDKVLQALKYLPEERRTARFYCVIVLLRSESDPVPIICQGIWEGRVLPAPQGHEGFGYDPIFYVPTHHCSAAELPLEVKNKISHRGQALAQLRRVLQIDG